MPKSKVWPNPLPKGTPVQVADRGGRRKVGLVESSDRFQQTWIYKLEGVTESFSARRVRPLDVSDPDDLEVWLGE